MRKYSLFIFLFFCLHFSAQAVSDTQKLESLCRIWGFLKYYHPKVAQGRFNWDQQLFQKIDELKSIDDKKELNTLYAEWIDSLGKIETCSECSKKNDKVYFLKNFDLSWIENNDLFSKNVTKKLHYIENNRNLGESHYLGKGGRKVYFRNENSYGSRFTSQSISLLELFRYWNYVEYFFPYKYETDQNWNSVLTEMIPKFLNSDSDETYHLTLAELVTKTDDSHAYLFSKEISLNQYGNRRVPVEYSYAEGKLVVTKINSTAFKEKTPLLVGDVIYDVNGKTIPQLVNSFGKYVPASNSWGKIEKVKSHFLSTNRDSISMKIERGGHNLSITSRTYFAKDIIRTQNKSPENWKLLEKQIGYVNMGILKKEDLDMMYKNLQSTRAIIFDLRNYPNQTIEPLSQLILPEIATYYLFTFPETDYPGKFYSRKNIIGRRNKEYYKDDVVVLVNESTQSQAETTAMMLRQHPKAKLIGSNTSGANGDVITFKIAGLDTRFTGLGAYYPDGRETQRIGIIPDIIVKPTIQGIREGKDEVLERALLYIKTNN